MGKTWFNKPIPNNLGRVSGLTFLNDHQGFAFDNSSVFYTRDGGKVWKPADFKPSCTDHKYLEGYDARPIQVFFLDRHNGWLSFEDGRIVKSTDGGQSWCDLLAPSLKTDDSEKYFREIYFIDPLNGFGLAADGLLYKTQDGGETWRQVDHSIRSDDAFFFETKCFLISNAGLFEFQLR